MKLYLKMMRILALKKSLKKIPKFNKSSKINNNFNKVCFLVVLSKINCNSNNVYKITQIINSHKMANSLIIYFLKKWKTG